MGEGQNVPAHILERDETVIPVSADNSWIIQGLFAHQAHPLGKGVHRRRVDERRGRGRVVERHGERGGRACEKVWD